MMVRALNRASVTTVYQTASNSSTPNAATFQMLDDSAFAKSKSIPISIIILAVFNVVASAVTAASILYGSYRRSKRRNPKLGAAKAYLPFMQEVETFPFVLAVGSVVQGIIFTIAQARALEGLFTKDCSTLAQFVWPAIMIVPYIHLVFGLECSLRSLQKRPFQVPGIYNDAICFGAILVMLIGTWIPSHIFPQNDACFASLVWFASRYGEAGLIILSVVGGLLLISTVAILARLLMVTVISEQERVAASKMVYYLVLSFVSLAFIFPFFVYSTIGDIAVNAGMVATVVLNLMGLMNGLLHLFLQSNTDIIAFRPREGRRWIKAKYDIRNWGSNDLAFGTHMVDPITCPRNLEQGLESLADKQASLVVAEKDYFISLAMTDSHSSTPSLRFIPLVPNPTGADQHALMPTFPKRTSKPSSVTRMHTSIQSYSLFPTEASLTSGSVPNDRPPESVYDISDLTPPPAIFSPGASRHRRDSSIISSATVQIGLRLSCMMVPSMENAFTTTHPQITYAAPPSVTFNASSSQPSTSIPISTFNPNTPSSLKIQTQNATKNALPLRPPKRPRPGNINVSTAQSSTLLASLNKLLPLTPKGLASAILESDTKLRPAVYSPEKKICMPSPAMKTPNSDSSAAKPPRNNSLPKRSLARSVRFYSNEEQAITQNARDDWI